MINILPFIAIILYGFFDYVGYNQISPLWLYRTLQFILNIAIYTGLYFIGGWLLPIIFLILHETFIADLVYYFFFDTLKWYGGSYAGTAYKNEVLGDKVVWAWWTFYGIFTRLIPGKKNVSILGADLIGQASAGLVLSILMALFL